jgi:hypothetical protein
VRVKTDARRKGDPGSGPGMPSGRYGFERTTMSDIMARGGGSKATIYGYFDSKDELFAAALEHGLRDVPPGTVSRVGERPGPLARAACCGSPARSQESGSRPT